MSDSAPRSAASRTPAKIGRYDIIERLGSGRTGTVYRATDPFIGRALAIKTFRIDLEPGPQRDRYLQRFYHEARISGGLSHPNIVALFDVGEMDGLPYLVFEHVDGPTLDVALARASRFDSVETIRVVEQTALALDFAHSKGVVHRDVRPANIILAVDRRVRIAEFGIARIEGSQLTQHGEILGTPAYMSPEQIRGRELSASSDLFSLAVCAYEMLSGHRPFIGKTQPELLEALVYAPPTEPKELRSLGIPTREFMFVFERALAKDPSHRFADAASFARALKSCLGVVAEAIPVARVTPIAVPEARPVEAASARPGSVVVSPPPPAPPVAPAHFDTAATSAFEGEAMSPTPVSQADATLISSSFDANPFARSAAPPAREVEAKRVEPKAVEPKAVEPKAVEPKAVEPKAVEEDAAEATLISSPGVDLMLPKRPTEADVQAAFESGDDLPPTNRLSREDVEALLAKSGPGPADPVPPSAPPPESPRAPVFQTTLPGSEPDPSSTVAGALGDDLPPTRQLPRLPALSASGPPSTEGPAPTPAQGIEDLEPPPTREMRVLSPPPTEPSPAPSSTLMGDASSATQAGHSGANEDRTVMMTDAEKRAARVRPVAPAAQATDEPPPTRPLVRPAPARPIMPRPVRPSLAPKILLAAFGLFTIAGLGLGVMFLANAKRDVGSTVEMWNNLPVCPEAEVDKSPLLFSHENPQPVLEPGRVASVTLSWIVTPDGTVDDPKIEVSASPEIDAFVVETIRKWRYEPGQKDGKTVPVRVLRRYTFGQRGAAEGS